MKRPISTIILTFVAVIMMAQNVDYGKMSSMIRRIMIENSNRKRVQGANIKSSSVCAFVRINNDGDKILSDNGCRNLAQFDNIYIADIPLNAIDRLSRNPDVLRIEAGESCSLTMDTASIVVNALPVYAGASLPQAFTGKGVVMGVQDVGFDLTHPTFYDRTATEYRIKRFWDQLSTDTVGSRMPVGAEYTTQEDILAYKHSRDGLLQTHGTHTLGIAAGSGYDTEYRGMAYESDICIVNNAVTDDFQLIDSADFCKYTSATDALGFKYIFDYADEVSKPCVISFSEGYYPDFHGDDVLYHEVLGKMSGQGHIIVASAGNESVRKAYMHKPKGKESAGAFLIRAGTSSMIMRSNGDITLRALIYNSVENPDTVIIHSSTVLAQPDSLYSDTIKLADGRYIFHALAYRSCYNPDDMAFDLYIIPPGQFLGSPIQFSLEIIGRESDAELFSRSTYLVESALNPELNAGETSHNIHSPGSAPRVICVGATSYRQGFVNHKGEYVNAPNGAEGECAFYSSIGPTLDNRVKPDVMSPGTNVISAYSSYYIESNPNANDINSDVSHFTFNGRTYAWNANTGTSMSAPIVGGAIALWLQANPRLTPEDVMNIIRKTSKQHDLSLTSPNNYYGYGEIDVYKGLLEVLSLNNIEGISTRQPTGVKININFEDILTISFDNPPVAPFSINIYSTSGIMVISKDFTDMQPHHDIYIGELKEGVYAVQISSNDNRLCGSTLIRR